MLSRKWSKFILLEEIVDAHPEELRNQANMVPVIKSCQEMNAFATSRTFNNASASYSESAHTGGSEGRAP